MSTVWCVRRQASGVGVGSHVLKHVAPLYLPVRDASITDAASSIVEYELRQRRGLGVGRRGSVARRGAPRGADRRRGGERDHGGGPHGPGPGSITAIDPIGGSVDLKRGNTSDAAHPTALIPASPIETSGHKEPLCDLVEEVLADGTLEGGRFGAVRDLLARRAPRTRSPQSCSTRSPPSPPRRARPCGSCRMQTTGKAPPTPV